MHARRLLTVGLTVASAVAIALPAIGAQAGSDKNSFRQTNLESDIPGMAAFTDPDLRNPWGISASATSPMWVSDNGAGVTTLYRGNGSKDRKSTRLNSSHRCISYAVFCLKKT